MSEKRPPVVAATALKSISLPRAWTRWPSLGPRMDGSVLREVTSSLLPSLRRSHVCANPGSP